MNNIYLVKIKYKYSVKYYLMSSDKINNTNSTHDFDMDLQFATKVYVPTNATTEQIFDAVYRNSHNKKYCITAKTGTCCANYVNDTNDYVLMFCI